MDIVKIMMMNDLPEIGEQIIVNNIRYAKAIVSDVKWMPQECRVLIELEWNDLDGKSLGKSRVFHYDQNKTWFRLSSNN